MSCACSCRNAWRTASGPAAGSTCSAGASAAQRRRYWRCDICWSRFRFFSCWRRKRSDGSSNCVHSEGGQDDILSREAKPMRHHWQTALPRQHAAPYGGTFFLAVPNSCTFISVKRRSTSPLLPSYSQAGHGGQHMPRRSCRTAVPGRGRLDSLGPDASMPPSKRSHKHRASLTLASRTQPWNPSPNAPSGSAARSASAVSGEYQSRVRKPGVRVAAQRRPQQQS